MNKTLEKLKKDSRVIDAWDETKGANNDGYWVTLNGYEWSGCHSVHEFTIKKLLSSFANIKKCQCADCTRDNETLDSLGRNLLINYLD